MPEDQSDTKLLLLMLVLGAWGLTFGYSFVSYLGIMQGSDVVQGSSRMNNFIGWQVLAAMLAFVLWGLGRAFPKDSGMRRVSRWPMGMALLLILVLTGAFFYYR